MQGLNEFEKQIIKQVKGQKDQLIADIKDLVAIPSKRAGAIGPYPFGPDIQAALEKAIEIARREGLATKNVDNYMAYASLGKSDDYIGIFGHLDVVDEGNIGQWTHPPFGAEIHNNSIYGRGALDNKGPSLAAFYGLLALKNLGYLFQNEIRFIFGTDEESGMSDLEYYLTKEKPPKAGFVPDNKFPAIFAERGRLDIGITGCVDDFYEKYFTDRGQLLEKLGIDFSDETFAYTIIKRIEKKEKAIRIVLATPEINPSDLVEKIAKKARGLEVKLISYTPPAKKDKNSSLVQVLSQVYNDIMNENLSPQTTTGMTYAHYCPNVIGFGPSFPGQNGISHGPDEWIDIDDLTKMSEIYALAIYRLDQSI